jgi:hypothetical protein
MTVYKIFKVRHIRTVEGFQILCRYNEFIVKQELKLGKPIRLDNVNDAKSRFPKKTIMVKLNAV